jgi:hypothetical protein
VPTHTDTSRSFGPPGWEDVPVSPTPTPRVQGQALPDDRRRLDGRRTIAYLIDGTLIGPLVLVLSGGRRQRIGDFAAGTVVADKRTVGSSLAPPSLLTYVYPVAWIGAALGVSLWIGHGGEPYYRQMEAVCKSRLAYQKTLPQPLRFNVALSLSMEETRRLAAILFPARLESLRSELLSARQTIEIEGLDIINDARRRGSHRASPERAQRLKADVDRLNARYRELGMPNCAK